MTDKPIKIDVLKKAAFELKQATAKLKAALDEYQEAHTQLREATKDLKEQAAALHNKPKPSPTLKMIDGGLGDDEHIDSTSDRAIYLKQDMEAQGHADTDEN